MQRRGHCPEERFPRLRGDPAGRLRGTAGRRRRTAAGGPSPSVLLITCSAGRRTCRGRAARASGPVPPPAVVPWPGIASIRGRQATAAILRERSASSGKPGTPPPGGLRGCPSGPTSTAGGLAAGGAGEHLLDRPQDRLQVPLGAQQERRGVSHDRFAGEPAHDAGDRVARSAPASSTAERATFPVTESAATASAAATRSLPACVPGPRPGSRGRLAPLPSPARAPRW